MNELSLITGFKEFLRELGETSDKTYNLSGSTSIFQYGDEFKQFLQESLNIDAASIFSKSVSSIMDMKVVDGQLVDEKEYQYYLEKGTLPQEQESTTGSEGAQQGAETTSFETSDDPLGDVMVDVLNIFLQDENIKSYLDSNESGELDENEVYSFLTRIKGLDNDRTNVSLDDVILGINELTKQIKNERFNEALYGSQDRMTREERRALAREEIESRASQRSQRSERLEYARSQYSSNNSASNSSSSSYTTSYDLSATSLSNTDKEDLQKELETSQAALSEKQAKYNEIQNGTDSDIKAKKQNVDDIYNMYQTALEKVDANLKEELDEANEATEAQQNIVAQKEIEITQQETTISSLNSTYQSMTTNRQSLEIQMTELQSSLSQAEDEQKSSIQNKISSLQSEIDTAKTKEQEAKTKLDEAQNQLQKLKEEKNQQEMILVQKEEVKAGIEAKSQEQNPQLKMYLDEYNEAKNSYETDKQTALNNAKSEIKEAQNKVNEIQQALATVETKETLKNYTLGGLSDYNAEKGMDLVNAAMSLHGNNHTSGKQCGKGVGESIEAAFGYRLYGDGYEWAQNLENRSDWEEVTDEISAEELTSLPAGAVVSWSQYEGGPYGHVFISDGQGHEISDFVGNISVDKFINRGATYRVFIPV